MIHDGGSRPIRSVMQWGAGGPSCAQRRFAPTRRLARRSIEDGAIATLRRRSFRSTAPGRSEKEIDIDAT
jgi:hypothetical protein